MQQSIAGVNETEKG